MRPLPLPLPFVVGLLTYLSVKDFVVARLNGQSGAREAMVGAIEMALGLATIGLFLYFWNRRKSVKE